MLGAQEGLRDGRHLAGARFAADRVVRDHRYADQPSRQRSGQGPARVGQPVTAAAVLRLAHQRLGGVRHHCGNAVVGYDR